LLIGFAAMAGLLLFYFSPYILHLNDTLLSASGDGLKNFYTLAYYVKYDSGFWFTGMLYPYGEHVISPTTSRCLPSCLELSSGIFLM